MYSNFKIHDVDLSDVLILQHVKKLYTNASLKKDVIDKCTVIYNDNDEIIATVSKYLNTIKLLVVEDKYQGSNIANKLVTHMINNIYESGYNEVFVFTKPEYTTIFTNLGFTVIYQNDKFAFFTNRIDLFNKYLRYLENQRVEKANTSVIVMNANPFTNGHLHLIQKASENSEYVYIIPVKEDASLFTYAERTTMIKEGIKGFKNVKLLEGSYYLVSKNVFPSYFLASDIEVVRQQTLLDTNIFLDYIAKALKINSRFVGNEPYSETTNQYNLIMQEILPLNNIKLHVIDRLTFDGKPISATNARKYFINGDFINLANLVPVSTLDFLKSLDYKLYQQRNDLDKLIDKSY